jgi:radical SAM protein with 4Fe4S-binding SPASM domain
MGILSDQYQILSRLSSKRVRNASRVLYSYYRSKRSGKAAHQGLPISIAFEPTTSCNLRCPECPSGLRSFTRPTGMLRQDLYSRVIDELADTLMYLTFYFQGEPYLHPRFLEMVTYASERGIYTATSTNAHYLNEQNAEKTVRSGLNRLIISIDGSTQESYEAYRIGGKLEKVLEGAANIVAWKKKLKAKHLHTVFQFLVVKPNEHQIADVYKLAKKIGIDEVKLKTAQIYDYEQGSPLIPSIDRYSRYEAQADGSYRIKNRLLSHCWRMWHSCVITWDGRVVPCCFDKDAHHQLGSVAEQSFRELWQSEAYRQFRQALLQGRSQIEICKNCTEGTKVWI